MPDSSYVSKPSPKLTGRVAIVGNAPQVGICDEAVDGADHVIRFNHPHGFGGLTGTRLDELFLVNCGGQMRQWLADDTLRTAPHVQAARAISLPIHPDVDALFHDSNPADAPVDADGINYAAEASAVLRGGGHAVRVVPVETFCAACRSLGIGRLGAGSFVPSTGALALADVLNRTGPECRIDLFGFGFEGWEGHDWTSEERWVAALEQQGRVVRYRL